MKSKLIKFSKILFVLLLNIYFLGCKKAENKVFLFDRIEYYHSPFYELPGPPDKSDRFEVYYSDFVSEENKTNYTKMSSFGFVKSKINTDFSIKINDFFTDKNPGKYMPNYKCLNCYQDILLFYNKKELIGVAKFDFLCDKYCFTSFQINKNIYLKKNCLKYKYLFVHPTGKGKANR